MKQKIATLIMAIFISLLFINSISFYPKLSYNLNAKKPNLFEIAANFFNATTSGKLIDQISINITPQDWLKISKQRDLALQKGYRYCDKNCYVNALISINNKKNIKAQIRLKGALPDHFDSTKWSLRINIKEDGYYFKNMQNFSLQSPYVRGYQFESLFYQHLKYEGLIAPQYDFINLTINGKKIGVMALQEAFSANLLQQNHRNNGVVLKFDKYQSIKYQKDVQNNVKKLNWRKANIEAFNQKRIKKDPKLKQQLVEAKSLLKKFQNPNSNVQEIFDKEQIAKYLAIATLWSNYHSLEFEDVGFYYNNKIKKFQPVVSDASLHLNYDSAGAIHDYLAKESISYPILSNLEIRELFIKQINKMTSPKYLKNITKILQDQEQKHLITLYEDYPALPKFNPNYLTKNAQRLKNLNSHNFSSYQFLTPKRITQYFTCYNPGYTKNHPQNLFPININGFINKVTKPYFIEINNTLFNPDNCYSKNTALSKDLQIIEVKSLNKSIKIGNLDYENLILAPEKEGVRIPIKITGKVKKPIKLQIKLANQEQPYLLEINNDYIF